MINYNVKNYIKDVITTESDDWVVIQSRLCSKESLRLMHAGMGMVTESGEFLDVLKKYIYYGKKLDKINLKEEAGDLLYYIGVALDELGLSFEEVMETNIAKLKSRYPDKFNKKDAVERDLEKERGILENK